MLITFGIKPLLFATILTRGSSHHAWSRFLAAVHAGLKAICANELRPAASRRYLEVVVPHGDLVRGPDDGGDGVALPKRLAHDELARLSAGSQHGDPHAGA